MDAQPNRPAQLALAGTLRFLNLLLLKTSPQGASDYSPAVAHLQVGRRRGGKANWQVQAQVFP